MTVKKTMIRLATDTKVLVCVGLLFSMAMTTGFSANRHVTIAVDGHTVELNTPYRLPANILSQAGVTMNDGDECQLQKDADGNAVVTVNRAVPITIYVNGIKTEMTTSKATVGQIVSDLGYVGNSYKVDKSEDTKITSGLVINVKEVAPKQKVNESTPHFVHTPHGGNLQYKEELTMEASAYLPGDGDGNGITATGAVAQRGVVAVDPDVIPLGSRVYIPGYGEAIAADTGGAIYGNRIDLCMENYSEAINFGRRDIQVYLLE